MKNQITTIIEKRGLQPNQARPLLDSFGDYFVQAHKLVAKAKGIKVTDVTQVEEMQSARELRLELKNLRVEANKTRVVLKEGYLRGGQAVQDIFNDIKDIVKPMEDYLDEQEKFAQRVKEAKEAEVEQKRINQLSKYVEDTSVFKLHPSELSTESFEKLLKSSKETHEAKVEAEKKAEEERIAKEKAEKEEQERIRKENEKLKKEAEAREKKLKEEREAREKLEREAKEKKLAEEAKIQAQKEAEEKAKREEEEKQRQALLAPDKEKLIDFSKQLQSIKAPAVKSKEADMVIENAMEAISKAVNILQEGVKKL